MKTLYSYVLIACIFILAFATNLGAQGIPRVLTVQGLLTDAFGKTPMTGKHILKIGLYEKPIGGIPLHEQIDTLNLTEGLYQIAFGGMKGLPTSILFDKAYYIDMVVDGMPQTMRIPLQPAPYALMATNVAADAVGEEQLAPTLRSKLFPNSGKDGEAVMSNSVGGFRSVIAGGDNNVTTANYSSIIGGFNNRVSASHGTIGGGEANQASGAYSFVGGGRQNRAQAIYSSIVAGLNNVVASSGSYGSIGGGQNNSLNGNSATISGGTNNTAAGLNITIGGGADNKAMNTNITISGGQRNIASQIGSTVAGGMDNVSNGQYSVLSGGTANNSNSSYATVGGGNSNSALKQFAAVMSGKSNVSNGDFSVISGGNQNSATGNNDVIGGGDKNKITKNFSTISGGQKNLIENEWSTISGGLENTIRSDGDYSTIAGGSENNALAKSSTISGGFDNKTTGTFSTVLGGQVNLAAGLSSTVGGDRDTVLSDYGTVSGGFMNEINAESQYATNGGGRFNYIAEGFVSTIGGGEADSVLNSSYGTIGGGILNVINEGSDSSTISGGSTNLIYWYSDASTIGGGLRNSMINNILSSTISGGEDNTINNESETDSIYYATIGGGKENAITETSDGTSIGGGFVNTIEVESDYSTIGGGDSNTISTNVYASIIGGGEANEIKNESDSLSMGYSTGPITTFAKTPNPSEIVALEYSTIGGGNANTIVDGSTASTIGGGSTNNIEKRVRNSFIGGGEENEMVNDNSLFLITGLTSGVQAIPGVTPFLTAFESLRSTLNPLIETANNVIQSGPLTGEEQEKLFIPTIPNPLDPEFTSIDGSTIGGGLGNSISEIAEGATIAGGSGNAIEKYAPATTIGGGDGNTISFFVSNSTIGGGEGNVIENKYKNDRFFPVFPKVFSAYSDPGKLADAVRKLEIITLEHATIAGGEKNEINDMSGGSSVGGGSKNKIESEVEFGVIAGGEKNEMNRKSSHSVISGGEENKMEAQAEHSSVGGGEKNEVVFADHSFVGSGEENTIKGHLISVLNPDYIAGIDPIDDLNMDIPGPSLKKAAHSFIGSGEKNEMEMTEHSAIVSGETNEIKATVVTGGVDHSAILSGNSNKIQGVLASVDHSAILSGENNEINANLTSQNVDHSAIVGGEDNKIEDGADHSTIGGGKGNTITGSKSFAFGEGNSVSADLSMALGEEMEVLTGNNNEFRARFDGGFYFQGKGDNGDFDNHVASFVNTDGKNGISIQIDAPVPNNSNNFVTFRSMGTPAVPGTSPTAGTVVGRIEGQTAAEFTNDYDYQAELQSAQMAQAFATSWNSVATAELTTASTNAGLYACPFSGAAAIGPALVVLKSQNVAATAVDMANMTQAFTNFQTSRATAVGVTYLSGAGDYAEMLPKADPSEKFMSGQIVAVKGGKITKNTNGASQLMVISRKPIVLGNASEKTENDQHEKVAFLGQVPVVVRGEVALGDYILPDGLNMGIGTAVKPANMKAEDYKRIVGVAWSTSEAGKSLSEINVAVGLNGLAISQEVDKQHAVIAQQNEELNSMKEELSALKTVLKGMNQALAQINPEYAQTVKNVLGNDAESIVKENKVVKVKTPETTITSSVSDMEVQNAVVLWRKQLINSGNSMENQPLLTKFDNDPAFRASVLERLKEVMNRKKNAQSSINSINN